MDPFDLSGVATRLDAASRLLHELAVDVAGTAEVRWRSGAADLFREQVDARARQLLDLARDAEDLSGATLALGHAAGERASLAAEVAETIAAVARPKGPLL